jgi:mRNA interferase MazF
VGTADRPRIVVTSTFVPDSGDLIWLTFDPQAGHEQAGRRPALVLSPKIYNQKSGLALACPITNRAKGYPFEVSVPAGCGVTGVILSDQVKSVDWKARRAEKLGRCPAEQLNEVLARLAPLLSY